MTTLDPTPPADEWRLQLAQALQDREARHAQRLARPNASKRPKTFTLPPEFKPTTTPTRQPSAKDRR